MTPLPKLPTGDSALVEFCRQLLRCVAERTPLRVTNAILQEFPIGFRLNPRRSNGGGSDGAHYRGEYTQSVKTDGDDFGDKSDYVAQDIVRVSPANPVASIDTYGADAALPGIYVCVQDSPASNDWPIFPEPTADADHFWDLISTFPSIYTVCKDSKVITVYADAQEQPAD